MTDLRETIDRVKANLSDARRHRNYWVAASPGDVERILDAAEASLWKPIESAPERTNVLVFIPTAKQNPVRVGRYGAKANGSRLWTYGGEFAFDVGIATHWLPLPQPPKK